MNHRLDEEGRKFKEEFFDIKILCALVIIKLSSSLNEFQVSLFS